MRSAVNYGRIGSLTVALCRDAASIRAAQRLRYDVFYRELSAVASPLVRHRSRDEDRYDGLCDHFLVFDADAGAAVPGTVSGRVTGHVRVEPRGPAVVGTYRVLRQDRAARAAAPFYSQSEYDIAPLLAAKSGLRFMELGRSCVAAPYRNRRTVELLWHAIWRYAREHRVDCMIGCASFDGVEPEAHAMALSFLHHHRRVTPEWHVRAHPERYESMNLLPPDKIDMRAALRALPPLIKGYVRLGCMTGDGCVIDPQFRTTDVFICLPVSSINPRYFAHFGAPDG